MKSVQLSEKKHIFLNEPRCSKPLHSCQVDLVTQFYKEKYDITILKNGGSSLGQTLIKNGQNRLREQFQNTIAAFQNEATRYNEFIGAMQYAFWMFDSAIKELCGKLFVDYSDENRPGLRRDLTPAELEAVCKIIINSPLKMHFDQRINEIIQEGVDVSNYCLTSEEVKQEIAFICENIPKDQVVGYVFTNGEAIIKEHFEVILISKNQIIKPVTWFQTVENNRKLMQETHGMQDIAWSELRLDSPDLIKKSRNQFPEAQTDKMACGTLGFLYLKELLKNNSYQLQKYTLSFPLDNDTWIFYPSPQVLRYSQSSTYNKLVCSMLNDTESIQFIESKNETHAVSTLKKLLLDGIKNAQNSKNSTNVKYNQAVLERLPEFRKNWMAVYSEMIEKRSTMNKNDINHYLAYSSHRLFNKPGDAIAYKTWESWSIKQDSSQMSFLPK